MKFINAQVQSDIDNGIPLKLDLGSGDRNAIKGAGLDCLELGKSPIKCALINKFSQVF
jgi:hypothetical protein